MLRIFAVLVLLSTSVQAVDVGSADLNGDEAVNMADWMIFIRQFNSTRGDMNFVEDLRASDVLPVIQKLDTKLTEVTESFREDMARMQREIEHRVVVASAPCKIGEVGPTWASVRVDWDDLPDFIWKLYT